MKKGKYENQDSSHLFLVRLLCFTLILILVVILLLKGCNSKISLGNGNNNTLETTVEKNPDSIAIPGYEVLELQADSKNQILCLPNPHQNVCYFQISLFLEDGTLLWESELIEPGSTSKPIILVQTLEKGTYSNAILKYSCFKMDGKTPLNGAETKLTLWVK